MSGIGAETSIDLWHFPIAAGEARIGAALALLDAEEREQFRRYEVGRLGAAFAIRRAARRILLAGYAGTEPIALRFRTGEFGKPELDAPARSIQFNASHSAGRGVLAVTGAFPLGVDIERLRTLRGTAIAERALAPAERLELSQLDVEARNDAILRFWTGKEAVLKAAGRGLALPDLPLIDLSVEVRDSGWTEARLRGRLRHLRGWLVRWTVPATGYVASISAPVPARLKVIDGARVLADVGILDPANLAQASAPSA